MDLSSLCTSLPDVFAHAWQDATQCFWLAKAVSAHALHGTARLPAVPRIIAIGDVHGDLLALKKCLEMADVIDLDANWVGDDTVVVQVGDVFDRGDHERAILHYLDDLHEQAGRVGGAVHRLLGNHEIMNAEMDFRYVTAGGFSEFRERNRELAAHSIRRSYRALPEAQRRLVQRLPRPCRDRAIAMAPGSPTARKLAERGLIALIIGDTLFVHGGLRPDHIAYGIERMNQEAREWLANHTKSEPVVAATKGHVADAFRKPSFLRGTSSPIWMRHYSSYHLRPSSAECGLLNETLRQAGVVRMVVGHTPQPHINGACKGRVWRIDTGISAAYGGKPEVLEISSRFGVTVITPQGREPATGRRQM